jgi:hypothetical protein
VSETELFLLLNRFQQRRHVGDQLRIRSAVIQAGESILQLGRPWIFSRLPT